MTPDHSLLLLVGSLGAAIGVGKLLLASTPLTLRLLAGHMIVTGGLAIAGLSVLALVPGLAYAAQVGVSCALAVLGTVYLEKALDKVFLKDSSSESK